MVRFTPEQKEVIKGHPIANIIDTFRDSLPRDVEQCESDEGTYFKLMSLPSSNTNRCQTKTRELPQPARLHQASRQYHTCKLARQLSSQDSRTFSWLA